MCSFDARESANTRADDLGLLLAFRNRDSSVAARKKPVMADTTLCADMNEPKKDIFGEFVISCCPYCQAVWPRDRLAWALPGTSFRGHVLEHRTVTFCVSCPMTLYCPATFDLRLYDLGLYRDVVLTPTCTVVDSVLGLKWLWKASTSTASQRAAATIDRVAFQALLKPEWTDDGAYGAGELAELAELPSGAEVRASERKERERQVAELRGEIRQVKRKRAHSDSQFGEPAEFKGLAACGLPQVKRQRLLSDSPSNFALRMRSRVLDDRTRKTLIEQFLDAKHLCQSLKTLFVITPESSFLTVPLDRDRSNLKLLQKSVGAEVVSFHPINGGNFDGWLLVINDYPEGAENRMITELVGSPFTIKGRAILAPPGVID